VVLDLQLQNVKRDLPLVFEILQQAFPVLLSLFLMNQISMFFFIFSNNPSKFFYKALVLIMIC
jgi:hypothetical protein